MIIIEDRFEGGKWLQRKTVDGKYRWTTSGVLWNNIKERTTEGSTTQRHEPTYIGSSNNFNSYREFVEWNRKQVGYGIGYDLDADLLRDGAKVYSENTCLLLPPALNRFLQTSNTKFRKFVELPTGVCYCRDSKTFVYARMETTNTNGDRETHNSPKFHVSDIEKAKQYYLTKKNQQLSKWIEVLKHYDRPIDKRVIERLEEMEFYYEEGTYTRWRFRSV